MCIEFNGGRDKKGYGRKYFWGRTWAAHRLMYCIFNKVKPEDIKGLVVRHKCDNPPCVDPLHLEIGTSAENQHDKAVRGRAARGSKNAHAKLTPEQVIEIRLRYKPRCKINGTKAMGVEYGVSQAAISCIITGKNWGWHV